VLPEIKNCLVDINPAITSKKTDIMEYKTFPVSVTYIQLITCPIPVSNKVPTSRAPKSILTPCKNPHKKNSLYGPVKSWRLL
jgi:hypothetical protein